MKHPVNIPDTDSSAAWVVLWPTGSTGRYLQGPRTPQQVRKEGYGRTPNIAQAWKFPSLKQAEHKARVVNRHIGWDYMRMSTEPVPG